jgi:catalase
VRSARNDSVQTRKVAILVSDGCDADDLHNVSEMLLSRGAQPKIVAPHLGYLQTKQGTTVKIHFSLLTASSVLFDAVFVPGGADSVNTLKKDSAAWEFIGEPTNTRNR